MAKTHKAAEMIDITPDSLRLASPSIVFLIKLIKPKTTPADTMPP